MKLAIIGSGPLGLFAAAHFNRLGAHVVLFQRSPLGGNARFCFKNNLDINIDYPTEKSVNLFWEEDLIPLIEFVEEAKISKAGDVLRVHKRFLNQQEIILNRPRFADLFRVVFSVNPKESILKQVAENPEIFKQLGENVLNSLHEPVESFEDFDIVIEASGRGKSDFKMGPSGSYAINEKNLQKHSHFYYGKEFFEKFDPTGMKHLMVVGLDLGAYFAIEKLETWLFSDESFKLYWVMDNQIENNSKVQKIIQKSKEDFNQKKLKFESELREWRDLEDYMKAKVTMPKEPEEKLFIFEGYNISSVDKLLDKNGVFITLESPDFRDYAFKKDDLKTIPVDAVIVQNGIDANESLSQQLVLNEDGFYILKGDSIKEGLIQILEIEKKVMEFFSKSDQ